MTYFFKKENRCGFLFCFILNRDNSGLANRHASEQFFICVFFFVFFVSGVETTWFQKRPRTWLLLSQVGHSWALTTGQGCLLCGWSLKAMWWCSEGAKPAEICLYWRNIKNNYALKHSSLGSALVFSHCGEKISWQQGTKRRKEVLCLQSQFTVHLWGKSRHELQQLVTWRPESRAERNEGPHTACLLAVCSASSLLSDGV